MLLSWEMQEVKTFLRLDPKGKLLRHAEDNRLETVMGKSLNVFHSPLEVEEKLGFQHVDNVES